MKPILKLVANILLIWGIAFASCKKTDQPIPPPPPPPTTTTAASDKTPVAIAGSDTTLNFPLHTTNTTYEAILDGKASYDKYGTIVFYSWTQISGPLGYATISNPYTDSTSVTMLGNGIYTFRLKIGDNNNSVSYDTVNITVNKKFDYEYDDLPWDSTSGLLTSLSLAYKPPLINGGIGLDGYFNDRDNIVFLCTSNGACENFSEWEKVPYVPYDSVSLTDKLFFYTITPDDTGDISMGYGIIYAKENAGIDFSKKVSVGELKE